MWSRAKHYESYNRGARAREALPLLFDLTSKEALGALTEDALKRYYPLLGPENYAHAVNALRKFKANQSKPGATFAAEIDRDLITDIIVRDAGIAKPVTGASQKAAFDERVKYLTARAEMEIEVLQKEYGTKFTKEQKRAHVVNMLQKPENQVVIDTPFFGIGSEKTRPGALLTADELEKARVPLDRATPGELVSTINLLRGNNPALANASEMTDEQKSEYHMTKAGIKRLCSCNARITPTDTTSDQMTTPDKSGWRCNRASMAR